MTIAQLFGMRKKNTKSINIIIKENLRRLKNNFSALSLTKTRNKYL